MSATILNTDTNINAKTVMVAENAETVTGLKTFSRNPNPPFVVVAGSANVPNLDADLLDGLDSTAFVRLANPAAFTDVTDSTTSTTGAITTAGGLGVAKSLSVGTTARVAGVLNADGGQIAFPAAQNASAGVNVLDDYEEGTWTPAITFGGGNTGITYGAQTGTYTKIGNLVYAEFRIALTAKGSSTGGASVTGLPFSGTGFAIGPVEFSVAAAGITSSPYVVINGTALLPAQTVTNARSQLADTNFTATTDMRGSITYRV